MSGRWVFGVCAGGDDGVDVVGGCGVAARRRATRIGCGRVTRPRRSGRYSNLASATTGAPPPPPSSNLVASYAFDEGTGTVRQTSRATVTTARSRAAPWTTPASSGRRSRSTARVHWSVCPTSSSLDLSTGGDSRGVGLPNVTPAGWRDVDPQGRSTARPISSRARRARPARAGVRSASRRRQARAALRPAAQPGRNRGDVRRRTVRLYVNGVQVASVAASGSIPNSSGPL